MYKSELHSILVEALKGTQWTRSTKDEDNLRQVLLASIYKHISPGYIEIPSTRSGNGDVRIFDRKVEIKYCSSEKPILLADVIYDFWQLLHHKIEFSIVAIKLGTDEGARYLHHCIHSPMLKMKDPDALMLDVEEPPNTYKQVGIFLPATYFHTIRTISIRKGKGKNSTAYMSFLPVTAIARSSFLVTPKARIHVDVIGSMEDGLLCFLYTRADGVQLDPASSESYDIIIPNKYSRLWVAKYQLVNAVIDAGKYLPQAAKGQAPFNGISAIESAIPCYTLYK